MKTSRLLSLIVFLFLSFTAVAQVGYNLYPTHWWTGMKWRDVQVMVHGDAIANASAFTVSYPGVTLRKVHRVENKNYVFLDLSISPAAKPGTVKIRTQGFKAVDVLEFPIMARRAGRGTVFAQGVRSEDFIYLLMPDRFSNGDPRNDKLAGFRDQSLDRDSIFHRHGGDLAGVENHLDYLQSLGVTALWMTPVLENDMPNRTEHGYAITNHYKVDARHGGSSAYKSLSDALHRRGMKLIQDAVYNHCGIEHFFIRDMPSKDWVHQWPQYTNTTYKDQPLMDLYAAKTDVQRMSDGWFVPSMPDLNQNNPFVANFLIQHALWSVEEFGLDGWRIDTYIYNDLPFMNRCNKALLDEYPRISMFGETWVHGVAGQAYFTEHNMNTAFKSNLTGLTDFQTNLYGINPALTQKFGWTDGVAKLYQTLAQDFLYKNPMNHVVFLDNHDMSRFLSQMGEDYNKLKMGIGWLLTTRGIPQLYYGTEVGMKGVTNPDGWVRLDFPGGWAGDKKSAFTGAGLERRDDSLLAYTRWLGMFRRSSSAIKTGKLMQYVPEESVYVYFRYDDKQTVMVVMNTGDKAVDVKLDRFAERLGGARSLKPVGGGAAQSLSLGTIKSDVMSLQIFEVLR